MAVTLNQLSSFLAVAREGSVSGAASKLYVTQPSISAAVSALSRELGVELTERVGRGIGLTAAGEAFRPYAADVLGLVEQGRTAACNMLGRGRPHQAVPYFFSDLADWVSLEYVGPAATWDEEVLRGSLDDGDFTLFYLQDRRVLAALGVGPSSALDHARRLIVAATRVADPAVLADGDLSVIVG